MTVQPKGKLTLEEKARRYDLVVEQRNSWELLNHNQLVDFIESVVEGDPELD